jgi:hypothetical protein
MTPSTTTIIHPIDGFIRFAFLRTGLNPIIPWLPHAAVGTEKPFDRRQPEFRPPLAEGFVQINLNLNLSAPSLECQCGLSNLIEKTIT